MNNESGKWGEEFATDWLTRNGYTILHKNWRFKRLEVDIIASRQGVLHFVEVKTRSSIAFGYPEESVSSKKLSHLLQAAEEYQVLYPKWQRLQIDIISIIVEKGKPPQIQLFEDVS